MNQPSQQLDAIQNLCIGMDQPLKQKEIRNVISSILGENCVEKEVNGKKLLSYTNPTGKEILLLTKAITYLGNPHPIFKKRIQIPTDWIEFTQKALHDGYDVRFLGVYHYEGLIMFVDFVKDTYLNNKCHNSSAHVYINDLYQGLTQGYFEKQDRFGNFIHVINYRNLKAYFNNELRGDDLIRILQVFNEKFEFNKWIEAQDAIIEMHDNDWANWKQGEWPGWFLEYKFSRYVDNANIAPFIVYTGMTNKKHASDLFDFDLWFPKDSFYGDLKASSMEQTQSPGNDQNTFVQCVNRYGRFWYLIFEHETLKDELFDFEATKFRNRFIQEKSPKKEFDEMSYSKRMKNRINFRKMYVIELNRINFHQILSQFNQGHQPTGGSRAPKFLINKRNIDNFVIYRYERKAIEEV